MTRLVGAHGQDHQAGNKAESGSVTIRLHQSTLDHNPHWRISSVQTPLESLNIAHLTPTISLLTTLLILTSRHSSCIDDTQQSCCPELEFYQKATHNGS